MNLFLKSFFTTSFFKVFTRLITLFCFSLLAKNLNINDFGYVSFSWVAQNTMIPLLIFGGNLSIIKNADAKTIINSLFITLFLFVIIILSVYFINKYLLTDNKIPYLLVLNSLLFSLIRHISGVYRNKKQIFYCEFFEQFIPSFLFLISILLGFWFTEFFSFSLIFLVISLMSLIIYLIHFYFNHSEIFNGIYKYKTINKNKFYNDLLFSTRVFTNNLGNLINYNITRLSSNFLMGSKFVGIIQPAFQISVSVNTLTNSLRLTSLSFSSKNDLKKPNTIKRINDIISIQLFIILIIILFGHLLIKYIYGNNFIEYVGYLYLLLFGQIFMVINGPINSIMILNGYEKLIGYISTFSILFNIIGNIYFLSFNEIDYAILTTSLSISIISLLPFLYYTYYLNNKLISNYNVLFTFVLIFLNFLFLLK